MDILKLQDLTLVHLARMCDDIGRVIWFSRTVFDQELRKNGIVENASDALSTLFDLEYIEQEYAGFENEKIRITEVGLNFYNTGYRFWHGEADAVATGDADVQIGVDTACGRAIENAYAIEGGGGHDRINLA